MLQPVIAPFEVLKGLVYEAGSRVSVLKEQRIPSIPLKVIKFNNRPKPNRRNCQIFSLLGEFGSNTIGRLYGVYLLIQQRYLGKYTIVLTWPNNAFLWKGLVDEVWELEDGDYISELRNSCRAFHNVSPNLKRLETLLDYYGTVVGSNEIGSIVVNEVFKDVVEHKKDASWPFNPSEDKVDFLKKMIKPNSVIISGRARSCYGRNLKPEFFNKLINLLVEKGYNIVWTGEKSTSLPCVLDNDKVVDFMSMPESNDMEYMFALSKLCKFSIHFYTAGHRFSGISGLKHIIVESVDQLLGTGQELMRLYLADRMDKRKLIISHFWDSFYSDDKMMNIINSAIDEIEIDDFSTKIGLVENPDYVRFLIKNEKRAPIY